ncbi:hypothetical protein ACW95P_02805 [Candidatus Mycoplasma pogonae]
MKKTLKWIGSLSAIAVVSSAAALFVFQPWNKQENVVTDLALKTFNYNLVAKAPIDTKETTKPGEKSLVEVAKTEEAKEVATTPKTESSSTSSASGKTDVELLNNIKDSTNSVLDAYLKATKTNEIVPIEEVETLETTPKTDIEVNEDAGGYGTYNRQRGKYNGKWNSNTYAQGGQESTQTMTALVYSQQKFKALKSGAKKINSADFKFIAVNSLFFTGAEILELDEEVKKAAVDFMNKDLEETIAKSTGYERQRWDEWQKVAPKRTVDNLTDQEISWLKQGMFPTSAFSWGFRPAFINTYVYEQTKKNLDRYIPVASSSQLGQDDIFNLNFNGNSSTETKNKWEVKTEEIQTVNKTAAVLKTYKNTEGVIRYIVEIFDPLKINDSSEFLELVKKQVGESFTDLGVVVRDIKDSTVKSAAEIVKKLPSFVKSLTLFYETSNPSVVNALGQNTNFDEKTPLFELNIVGSYNNGNSIDDSKVLNSVDPQVFVKVRQGTFSYGTNVIFKKFEVGSEVNKQLLENIFKLVYIKDKDRREFQGEFGSGGYVTNWDLSKTELIDLNNMEFPQRDENQPLKLTSVLFSEVKNNTLNMNLSDLSVDNTDKISEHGSVMYGKKAEKQPTKLVLEAKSSRSTQEDIETLVRVFNYSHQINIIDLSSVSDFTEEAVKKLFINVNRKVTVKTADGEFAVEAKAKTESK